MNSGWVCLHRKMLDWEWFSDHNTFRLFTILLLMANHKDRKWRGIDVPKGSLITGRDALALKTGLSVRQVRTVLNKLKSTNDIAIKTNTKYSMISITNWDMYQSIDQHNDQLATNHRPASDQPPTTNNNETIKPLNKKEITLADDEKKERASENKPKPEAIAFDDFYKKYPIKKSKTPAMKKWKLLSDEKRKLAINGIEKYKASVPEGISFVHPSTYLSQERWTDEVTIEKSNNQQAANQLIAAARLNRI